MKELPQKFKKQFTYLGESIEKYITFTVPVEKQLQELIRMEKKLQKYILRITIYSAKFMASLLSNLVHNVFEGIHRIRCKYRYDDDKCEICRIKYKYCDCFLEYKNFKDDLIE